MFLSPKKQQPRLTWVAHRWIQTDGGLLSAKLFGLDEAMTNQLLLKQGESHPSMMKLIDEATRETHGGKFLNYDSKEIPW
jgi:norsolorinic acid ketoreductase